MSPGISASTPVLSTQRLDVVDGQQRLTTLYLLFAAIYQTLKNRENGLNDDQRVEQVNLKRKLILKKGYDELRVIPQIQNYNQDDYRFATWFANKSCIYFTVVVNT